MRSNKKTGQLHQNTSLIILFLTMNELFNNLIISIKDYPSMDNIGVEMDVKKNRRAVKVRNIFIFVYCVPDGTPNEMIIHFLPILRAERHMDFHFDAVTLQYSRQGRTISSSLQQPIFLSFDPLSCHRTSYQRCAGCNRLELQQYNLLLQQQGNL